MSDTIFALSSGRPPAAIGVVRISGPNALDVAARLMTSLPPPRQATLRTLRDADGQPLDRALVLLFPGPATATGEDLVELHCHGGRAVVAAVEAALAIAGARHAQPGEFTRRALENGRIDLAQAQGLADLLSAETEGARRAAFAASEGAVGRAVRGWMAQLAGIAAQIEAGLDFSDEDDVDLQAEARARAEAASLARELADVLAQPSVERLNQGLRVVLAGPPNAGKSSLFNALLERDAAIVTPIAGTTRDVIEAAVTHNGTPFLLVDTAGLRDASDEVERIGVDRARQAVEAAELVLWLGAPDEAPAGARLIHAQTDLPDRAPSPPDALRVSIHDPASIARLWSELDQRASSMLTVDAFALRREQREIVDRVRHQLKLVASEPDALVGAEHCRTAMRALSALLGVDATETMLDALFGRFCIGK